PTTAIRENILENRDMGHPIRENLERLNDLDFSDPKRLHAQTIPRVVLRARPVLRRKGPAAGTPAKGRDAGAKHLGESSASDGPIRQVTLSLADLLALGERHGVQTFQLTLDSVKDDLDRHQGGSRPEDDGRAVEQQERDHRNSPTMRS